ncbi:MAG TPA: CoA transferase [Candidatus Binatia bacterium]|nr:CoA transferase [Candidatus Binatia bacterium]
MRQTALGDVLVLDLTETFWGGIAAAMLGDFGADVARIESVDPKERRFPDVDEAHEPGSWNFRFDLAHRNKRSVAVDLESEQGRAIVHALVAKADIVLTDRSSAWLEARGLDLANCRKQRSDILYISGSGFGPAGLDAELPALDELAAARTGMMPILVQPGEPPVYPGHGQMYTSVMLAFGAVSALYHRRQSGEGQRVDASLLAGNMYGASLDLQAFLAIGGERFLKPTSRLDAGNPMSGTNYPTSDGVWVTLTMPETDRWWPQLAEITGLRVDDPRFATHDLRCGEHRLVLMELLDLAFRKHPAAHWRKTFNDRQMSADIIDTYDFPLNDEMARDNRYILDLEDASLGRTSMLGFPIFKSETPASLTRVAPRLGQHTAEVLRDVLGYTPARIGELTAAKAIG